MKPPQRLRETDLGFALLHAAKAIDGVLKQGVSLPRSLEQALEGVSHSIARATVIDLAHFGMRHLGLIRVLWPLLSGRAQLQPVELESMLGLALALLWVNTPHQNPNHPYYEPYTLVNQAVAACAVHRKWLPAKGLVNACLRAFLRDPEFWRQRCLEQSSQPIPNSNWNAPRWWIEKLQQQHPGHWQSLLQHSAEHPPMVLRVNSRCLNAQQYSRVLQSQSRAHTVLGPQAIGLHKPCPVDQLPGFFQGHVSVQDLSAQMAVPLLNPNHGQRVLDACAAPGGKTGHLLEWADIDLTALDSSSERLSKVQSTVDRLAPTLGKSWHCALKQARAERLDSWWDGQSFDLVLADVPCSGSGVVRRHPDIPWLRRPQDFVNLSRTQLVMACALWATVKPGGRLLLSTCSVFAEEGPWLSEQFIKLHSDAQALPAPGCVLPNARFDNQIQGDGFFYALFLKQHPSSVHLP